MNTRSKGQKLGVILSMIALVFGLIYGGSFTTASGAVLVSCPEGYVVSGSNCTLTTTYPASTTLTVDYLIVAGGGAGGTGIAGGGGGGGISSGSNLAITTGSSAVVVGAGGNYVTDTDASGLSGGDSSFAGVTATGGGGGGGAVKNGLNGGSGGGGGGATSSTGGAGTSTQGSAGGTGFTSGVRGGGGGGGYSATGTNGTSTSSGNGGAGLTSTFSGSSVTYSSGGGGGADPGATGGGASSGAGAGGLGYVVGGDGTANTGGGGGGGGISNRGGNGGSGVVIIRYSGTTAQATGGTITTGSAYTFHTFTASGTFMRTGGTGTCTAGDTLSGSTCTNVVTVAGTLSSDYCPVGSIDDPNDKTKCIKIGGPIAPLATPSSTYTCPNGYFLLYKTGITVPVCQNGVASYEATTTTTYTCPTGGRLVGIYCYIDEVNTSSSYNAFVSSSLTCPQGGNLVGAICYVASTLLSTVPALQTNTTTYSCPDGGTLYGSLCSIPKGKLLSVYSASVTNSYNCPNGYWETLNDQCKNSAGTITSIVITSIYWCPNGGDLSGTTCYITTNFEYNATGASVTIYSCEDGKVLSQNGIECLRYSLSSQYPATSGTPSYSCPNGGTLAGSLCITSIISSASSYNASSTYLKSCPKGGTLTSNTCGFEVSEIAVVIVYNGSCATYYIFNKTSLLCDPISYSYVGNTLPTLVGVYFCETYSDGNLIYTGYYGYDASSLGIIFERKCSLQTNVEGSINDSNGYFLCEIVNKATQEVTTIILSSDITGFKDDRKTTCTFVSLNIPDDDVEENLPSEPITEVCDVSLSYGAYLVCIMVQNS